MHKFPAALAAALVMVMGSANAASVEDLQKQIDAQQRTMLDLQNRITDLTTQVNTLRGDLEQLRYQIARMPSSGTSVAAAQSAAAHPAPTSGKAAVPAAQTAAAPAAAQQSAASESEGQKLTLKPVDAAAQAEYDKAYQLVLNNQLSEAAAAFDAYLQKYSDNTLTPNAWYWLGQVQYKQNLLDNARVSFLNVARFTSSTKRPDALYKLGLISKLRGDTDKAAAYFNLVIKTYPADTSSNLARTELSALQ